MLRHNNLRNSGQSELVSKLSTNASIKTIEIMTDHKTVLKYQPIGDVNIN